MNGINLSFASCGFMLCEYPQVLLIDPHSFFALANYRCIVMIYVCNIYIDLGENANNSQGVPRAWYSRCIILIYIYILYV